ncbi:MAG: hypothetical protein M1825_003191 [Sarcosagium campestre]|nr:MAG: hypothetical protein M1825_003191 [Sarcosagium campestre]
MRRPPSSLLSSATINAAASPSASIHAATPLPLVNISNGTFYRHHPSFTQDKSNPALFPNLTFTLPSSSPSSSQETQQHWSVIGPSSSGKTTFLNILRGYYICSPPNARTFPYLTSDSSPIGDNRLRSPERAFQYVGFGGKGSHGLGATALGSAAYLSARYESRREDTDFSVLDYLNGHTQLNALEEADAEEGGAEKAKALSRVVEDLRLENLVDLPVGNLSNGQTRRAKIAKALMARPEVLLLDDPFMGLDPMTTKSLPQLLYKLASASAPRIMLSLRPQDRIPDWITHIVYLHSDCRVAHIGPVEEVMRKVGPETQPGGDCSVVIGGVPSEESKPCRGRPRKKCAGRPAGKPAPDPHRGPTPDDFGKNSMAFATKRFSRKTRNETRPAILDNPDDFFGMQDPAARDESTDLADKEPPPSNLIGEPLFETKGLQLRYGDRDVLGGSGQLIKSRKWRGLTWKVRRGQRWGLYGPNGSGKSTLLSLVTSDHPQSYSLPIRYFGRSRLPQPGQPGISLFDIQARIGHASPEIHNLFPRQLTVRQTLENAWADTFRSRPILNHHADQRVDACLRWFQSDLNPLQIGIPPQSQLTGDHGENHDGAFLDEGNGIDATLDEDLDWADELRFGDMPFSAQRTALFLRAIIKQPDIVILDEAFSGMDDALRDKCILFLAFGESWYYPTGTRAAGQDVSDAAPKRAVRAEKNRKLVVSGLTSAQALICVSHVKEEVPPILVNWLCLPETGSRQRIRTGVLPRGEARQDDGWAAIWDMK